MPSPRPRRLLVLAVLGALLAVLAAAVPAQAADAFPCRFQKKQRFTYPSGHGGQASETLSLYGCPLTQPRVPVRLARDQNSRIVGFKTGGNGFVYEREGNVNRNKGHTNRWWASTRADNGKWGWVGEVLFKGGGDNEDDGGLLEGPGRVCGVPDPKHQVCPRPPWDAT